VSRLSQGAASAGAEPAARPEATSLRTVEREGVVWLESAGPGWRAAFSTRLGGVSGGAFRSLNLSLAVGDDADAVLENRRRLAAAAGFAEGSLVVARQVHGVRVEGVGADDRGRGAADQSDAVPETDGLWTTTPDLPVSVSVADCVPVVVSAGGAAGQLGVAVLHAGWRGMVAGILARGAESLTELGPPSAAVVGPSIGPCCFTVGEDVAARFERAWPGSTHRGRVDLWEVARRQLEASGVPTECIAVARVCTVCDHRFFSHRRDRGRTGRQMAVAWLTSGGYGSGAVDGGSSVRYQADAGHGPTAASREADTHRRRLDGPGETPGMGRREAT